MSRSRMARAFLSMKRTRCSACGEHGRGAAEKFGVEDRFPLVYGTFSKAFGALGGFVAGSKETLAISAFLRASVCLFVRAAAGRDCGNSESAGNRHEPAGIARRNFGKTPITFTRNCDKPRNRYRSIDNLHDADCDR